MTEIEFHVNVPDKLQYACRLLRKAYRSGAKAVVTAEPDLLSDLDRLLWQFSPTEFLPHCMANAGGHQLAATPVLLAVQAEACPADRVLINLGQAVPLGFERFARFLEVVSAEEDDLQIGRARWKHYKEGGYALKRNDIPASSREAA